MKKIIIVFDGKHFSESAFEVIRRLNELSPILATGVFLPAVDYAELIYSFGGISSTMFYEEIDNGETGIAPECIDRFKAKCELNGIEYRIHSDLEKHVITEVKMESRYADLLIMSSELFYENLGKANQDGYIENALHKAECPVLLVPEHYKFPDNVILAYDGSESSVYAIKMFAYLLPEYTSLKTTLVFADSTTDMPDIFFIEELAARHFSDLTIQKLEVDPAMYFNTWLQDNKNAILVAGAYSRSALSEMLRASFVTEAIHDHKLPIFIAHR